MGNRVVHFEIEAKDLKRAAKFYQDAFGWEMQHQGEEFGDYVVAKSGEPNEMGINGGIFPAEKEKELNAFSCVIGVDDIHKAMDNVKAAGGTLLDEKPVDIPKIGLYVKCEDTEGNKFTLLQPDLSSMPQT